MPVRLDKWLVDQKVVASREQAKEHILAGDVYVNYRPCTKPSQRIHGQDTVDFRGDVLAYVSRGGLKLEKALDVFKIDLQGAYCVDIGASTGGFTDCMLQRGAAHVVAIDVGTDQLDKTLAADPRVTNAEQTNIRYLQPDQLAQLADFVATDVSFISLKHVLPVAYSLLEKPHGQMVCLIKPQFEAGPEHVNHRGVVTDPARHKIVIKNVVDFSKECGFFPRQLAYSPITGPEGNIEYLLWLETKESGAVSAEDIDRTVKQAYQNL